MNVLEPTGWFQLKSELLTADSPAVALPSPTDYDVYCLVFPPTTNDIYVVTEAGATISAMLKTADGFKVYGIFSKGVQLYAYAAVPTNFSVTPFGDPYGEMTELPVSFPDTGAAGSFVPWSVYQNAELAWQVDHDANLGTYRVQNIAGTGNFNFDFRAPTDFASLVNVHVHFVNVSATPGFQPFDFESMYHTTGEAYNINNQLLLGVGVLLPAVTIGGFIDVSSLFTSLGPDDEASINVKHNAIGGTLAYLSIVLKYLRIVV